ncbi:hypothetical protein F9047_11440 [Escherichia coli]|nr:hypothetical protein F9047_11440 [Escherichia coli]
MEKYLNLKEDTRFYRGDIEVMESKANPGMILIQLWMKDIENGDRDSAGIRLTREQARQMADHLNALADQLFFEEQRANANA